MFLMKSAKSGKVFTPTPPQHNELGVRNEELSQFIKNNADNISQIGFNMEPQT